MQSGGGKGVKRFKLFIENLLVYGIGGVISQIVPLIMLPVVTRLIPNTLYFGLNDISTTVVSFGSAIALMGMFDAMFRMFFEKEEEEYQKEICSTTLAFTLATSVSIFLILILFRKSFAQVFFGSEDYMNLLAVSAGSVLIGATNSIVSAPTRMQNKRKIYLITNTLSPIISYSISIPLLLKGQYIIALPLASLLSVLIVECVFLVINHKWFHIKKIKKEHLKSLLRVGVPLMPNFLIYWIFNSSDRFMILKLMGGEYSGIYAIGAKLGAVSQLIYMAFSGGWQYFSFSTMRDKDQVKMTSNIFEYLGIISFSAAMFMAAFSKIIFQILFNADYIKGSVVAPYLFFAPLLLMLFQVACNQFLIIKKTWPNILILGVGAIVNVVINYFGIQLWGIEGAGLGTLCGYIVSVFIVVIVLSRMKLLQLSYKFAICAIFCMLYAIAWRFCLKENAVVSAGVAAMGVCIYCFLYRKDLKNLLKVTAK